MPNLYCIVNDNIYISLRYSLYDTYIIYDAQQSAEFTNVYGSEAHFHILKSNDHR